MRRTYLSIFIGLYAFIIFNGVSVLTCPSVAQSFNLLQHPGYVMERTLIKAGFPAEESGIAADAMYMEVGGIRLRVIMALFAFQMCYGF